MEKRIPSQDEDGFLTIREGTREWEEGNETADSKSQGSDYFWSVEVGGLQLGE